VQGCDELVRRLRAVSDRRDAHPARRLTAAASRRSRAPGESEGRNIGGWVAVRSGVTGDGAATRYRPRWGRVTLEHRERTQRVFPSENTRRNNGHRSARSRGRLGRCTGAWDWQPHLGERRPRRLPGTWAARTEGPKGMTSSEELVAAAHTSCFAMALALVRPEIPPSRASRRRVSLATIVLCSQDAGRPSSQSRDPGPRAWLLHRPTAKARTKGRRTRSRPVRSCRRPSGRRRTDRAGARCR